MSTPTESSAPKAKGIIHLGATSCYVGDNTDVIILREGLEIVTRKLVNVIQLLADFALQYKDLPCLAYTHLQPAQLTTVGKRATLWINELMMDLEELEYRAASLKLLGSKGTTGTQASFVELFDGDSAKIKALEESIAREMGFEKVVPVSGQTYSRKVDANVLATPFPALPSLPANSPMTCGFCKTLRRWRNPLRHIRSVPLQCPTSAIPCAASASPLWPGM